jgi:hypothetical protein
MKNKSLMGRAIAEKMNLSEDDLNEWGIHFIY